MAQSLEGKKALTCGNWGCVEFCFAVWCWVDLDEMLMQVCPSPWCGLTLEMHMSWRSRALFVCHLRLASAWSLQTCLQRDVFNATCSYTTITVLPFTCLASFLALLSFSRFHLCFRSRQNTHPLNSYVICAVIVWMESFKRINILKINDTEGWQKKGTRWSVACLFSEMFAWILSSLLKFFPVYIMLFSVLKYFSVYLTTFQFTWLLFSLLDYLSVYLNTFQFT